MLTTLSFILLFACVMCLVWALMPDIAQRLIRTRVLREVGVDNAPTALSQLTELLAPINRRLPTTWYLTSIRKRLDSAGVRVGAMQFLVMQQLGVIAGLILYVLVIGTDAVKPGWLVVFVLMGVYVPVMWLGNRIAARRQSISRDLPEIVDLLTLCVDAGIDFMSALTRVVKEYKACPTTEELGLILREVRVGKRRRDALRAFARSTCELPSLPQAHRRLRS